MEEKELLEIESREAEQAMKRREYVEDRWIYFAPNSVENMMKNSSRCIGDGQRISTFR